MKRKKTSGVLRFLFYNEMRSLQWNLLKNWYVLHTYSGYENKVKANIESRAQSMKMADFIFRVVVPEEKKLKSKWERKRNRS